VGRNVVVHREVRPFPRKDFIWAGGFYNVERDSVMKGLHKVMLTMGLALLLLDIILITIGYFLFPQGSVIYAWAVFWIGMGSILNLIVPVLFGIKDEEYA